MKILFHTSSETLHYESVVQNAMYSLRVPRPKVERKRIAQSANMYGKFKS